MIKNCSHNKKYIDDNHLTTTLRCVAYYQSFWYENKLFANKT